MGIQTEIDFLKETISKMDEGANYSDIKELLQERLEIITNEEEE